MADLANLIPEALFPVSMAAPQLGNGITSDYINVSLAQMAWIVVHARVAANAAIVLTPLKAYAAAGTGATALTVAVPIWAGIITTASNVLTRQTDGVAYTTPATAGDHICIFQIDPATLGYEATVPSLGAYKYLGGTYVALVADYVGVTMWIKPRYDSKVANQPNYLV
jgi:hypothetical protein